MKMDIPKPSNRLKLKMWKLQKAIDEAAGTTVPPVVPKTATEIVIARQYVRVHKSELEEGF